MAASSSSSWEVQNLSELMESLSSSPAMIIDHRMPKEEHQMLCDILLASPASSFRVKVLHVFGIFHDQIVVDAEVAQRYARLLRETPSLENLSFSLTRIGGEGFRSILHSLLSSSLSITHLSFQWDVSIGREDGLRHLAPILSAPLLHLSLRNVGMGAEAAALLAKTLRNNSSLISLDISCNEIGDVSLDKIAHMLLDNSSLQILRIVSIGLSSPSTKSLGTALAKNKTLQTLDISFNPQIGEKRMDSMFPHTTTLKHLACRGAPRIFKAFAKILRNSTALTSLDLGGNRETEPSRVEELFKAIANNGCGCLQSLNLYECSAVNGDKVVSCILDALPFNSCLVDLNITATPLHLEPQIAVIEAQVKRVKEENVMRFPEMQKAKPNRIRVFLCGLPYAGKTTLKGSIVRASKGRLHSTRSAFSRDRLHSANQRTRGIDIEHIVYSRISISLWDLAGQEDYYSFHDFMFPNISHIGGPSLFLILCKPMDKDGSLKKIESIGKEIKYWLTLITSKARPSELFKPMVAIVFTHKDKPSIGSNISPILKSVDAIRIDFEHRLVLSNHIFHVNAKSSRSSNKILQYVHRTASDILSRWPRTYSACNQVRNLLNKWKVNYPFMHMSEFIYLCNDVQELKVTSTPSSTVTSTLTPSRTTSSSVGAGTLSPSSTSPSSIAINTMNSSNTGTSTLTSSSTIAITFSEKHKLVARTLNNAGDILYFPDLEYIIVDLAWFCESLIGQMIKYDGIVNRPNLEQQEELIEWHSFVEIVSKSLSRCKRGSKGDLEIQAMTILQIMQKMNLCYARSKTKEELKPDIFIPANLIPTIQSQSWEVDIRSPNQSILGRRLQCLDQEHTILTPNFFPQIQIALYNSFAKDNNIECKLRKDFIKIIDQEHHGMEIHLEFHGYGVDDVLNSSSQDNSEYEYLPVYIDLLLRSAQNSDRALKRLYSLVINEITEFCGKWRGCQGVTLIEGILRSDCVEQPEEYKLKQCVLRSTLEDKLMKIRTSEMHLDTYTWMEFNSLGKRVDHTKELLGEEAFMKVMNKRLKILQAVATEQETQEPCQNLSLLSAGTSNGALHRGLATNESVMPLDAVADEEALQEEEGKELYIEDSGICFDRLQNFMSTTVDRLEEVDARLVRIEDKVDKVGGDVVRVLQTMEEKVVCELRTEIRAVLDIVNGQGPQLQHNIPHLFYFTQRSGRMRERVANLVASVDCYQLRFYCEGIPQSMGSRHECDHEGLPLCFARSERLKKAMPYLNKVLKLVTMVAKVGAHIVAGAGDLVPDLAKLPALVFDSAVIDVASMKLTSLVDPEVVQVDHPSVARNQSAEQWLVDLLIENNCYSGKAISEIFGLYRVMHKKSSEVAWVCEEHKKHLEFVPYPVFR